MPALLVVLAVVGVGVGTWQLHRSTAASVTASSGAADGTDAGGDPTASPSPTTSPSPSASPTPTQTGPADRTADRTAPVTVLNGTRTSGLAGKAATTLRAAGWTVSVGNGRTTAPTSVFYATTDQQAAAQTLVSDLGVGVIEQSSRYGSRLTVLLGSDYPG